MRSTITARLAVAPYPFLTMRVLHTIATIDPATGGPARSVPQLLLALKSAGLNVALWTADTPQAAWLEHLQGSEIPIYNGDLNNLPRVDLIHDHGLWLMNNHRVASYARAKNIPRIVSPRGMLEPWALNHKKWKKRAAWWLYQRGNLQTAVSLHATAGSEARQFRKLGLNAPIVELPNGVEMAKTETQKTKTLKGEVRTALFLSRIHPKKGLPLLVGAWAKVKPAGWRMIVVGPDEGGHRAEIQAMVREQGLADVWEFRDACEGSAKADLWRDANLFILPTYSENFGIAVAEALAAGIPVITTTGAPWQGLLDHRCGWWVEPAMELVANALAEATQLDLAELAEMGKRGQRWVSRDFAWPGIASRMITAYREILSTAAL